MEDLHPLVGDFHAALAARLDKHPDPAIDLGLGHRHLTLSSQIVTVTIQEIPGNEREGSVVFRADTIFFLIAACKQRLAMRLPRRAAEPIVSISTDSRVVRCHLPLNGLLSVFVDFHKPARRRVGSLAHLE